MPEQLVEPMRLHIFGIMVKNAADELEQSACDKEKSYPGFFKG